jgi:hypothetical protein
MEVMTQNAGTFGLGLVALVLLGAAGWYFWCQAQKARHERHVDEVIRSLGLPFIKDVVLPDGVDGLVFMDYVLLTPKGMVALDIHHQEGVLFGGDAVDQWSQVVRNRTYKFPNPLYDHETRIQALKWNAEELGCDDVEATGWVVFSNAGNFPKGIPKGVRMIDDIAKDLESPESGKAIPEKLQSLWRSLHDKAIATRIEYDA